MTFENYLKFRISGSIKKALLDNKRGSAVIRGERGSRREPRKREGGSEDSERGRDRDPGVRERKGEKVRVRDTKGILRDNGASRHRPGAQR